MCGIVGYIGEQQAAPILLDGLKRLEYRGYDSAGLVVLNETRHVIKSLGKISELEKKLYGHRIRGNIGMSHCRWATHGKPSEINAHPHTDCQGKIFIVHNGIIENYQVLKQNLIEEGHTFRSETDSEVIAHLIEKYYCGDLESAVKRALALVEGTFGLAVLHYDHQDQIVLARRSSPLVVGIGSDGLLFASDVAALIKHTKKIVYLEDNEIATLTACGFRVTTSDNQFVKKTIDTVDWDTSAAEKQGFPHFMLKEIFEQPEALRNAMRGRLMPAEGTARFGSLEEVAGKLQNAHRIIMVSCGTSYHAGLVGRYALEKFTDYAVEVDLASEFRYRDLSFREGTVVLAISQSGETADTLAALREAKNKGALVLSLVNVVGSSIARETHAGVYNHAGPEIGVASTKSFTSQVTLLMLISLMLGRLQKMPPRVGQEIIAGLEKLPSQMNQLLDKAEEIKRIAQKYAHHRNFLYMGRKYNYPIALEGALKLKEISYTHAEGYAAGEMKHGPIAMIDSNFPSVCIAPQDSSYTKMISNMQEIKAREGKIIAIASEGDKKICEVADDVIYVMSNLEALMPILTIVPLQLFAYYIADFNGCEIDKPRNLAKSVTVE